MPAKKKAAPLEAGQPLKPKPTKQRVQDSAQTVKPKKSVPTKPKTPKKKTASAQAELTPYQRRKAREQARKQKEAKIHAKLERVLSKPFSKQKPNRLPVAGSKIKPPEQLELPLASKYVERSEPERVQTVYTLRELNGKTRRLFNGYSSDLRENAQEIDSLLRPGEVWTLTFKQNESINTSPSIVEILNLLDKYKDVRNYGNDAGPNGKELINDIQILKINGGSPSRKRRQKRITKKRDERKVKGQQAIKEVRETTKKKVSGVTDALLITREQLARRIKSEPVRFAKVLKKKLNAAEKKAIIVESKRNQQAATAMQKQMQKQMVMQQASFAKLMAAQQKQIDKLMKMVAAQTKAQSKVQTKGAK